MRKNPSMRTSRAALPLFALASLLAVNARAQDAQPTPSPFGEEVEVTEVVLDVLVTDRDGNVIVGLRPEDFVVEEGGRPVPLLDVSFYSNRPQLDAEGRPVQAAGSERYFVLFFHDQRAIQDRKSTRLNSSHGYISYAVFCLKKKKKKK